MEQIEINLSKSTIAMFRKVASLDAMYIDFYVEGSKCIVHSDNKGMVFAGVVYLKQMYSPTSFRISNQILKQVDDNHSLLRVFLKEDKIDIFMFFENINASPLKVSSLNSRAFIEGIDEIKDILWNKTCSDNSFIQYMSPLVEVSNIISGLANKDLLVSDGVVFVDNPEYKFFCDLGKSGLTLIVPDKIIKQIKYELGNKDVDFIISNGSHKLRCGEFLYCWKSSRVMRVEEYSILKSLEPKCTCAINLSNFHSFIQKLSISKNRDQSVYIDLEGQQISVNESGIIDYNVPVSVQIVEGTCTDKIKVDAKALREVIKNLNNQMLLMHVYPKFIVFSKKIENEVLGDIPYSFLLRVVR